MRKACETDSADKQLPGLSNDEIKTVAVGRRSFLAKVGVRSTAVFGVIATAACGGNDKADTDTQTDFDLGVGADPIDRKKDRADTD